MIIRKFCFKNNFFNSQTEAVDSEYCVIGYFDGMDVKKISESPEQDKNLLLPNNTLEEYVKPLKKQGENLNQSNEFTIYGYCSEDDDSFWQNEDLPYIFISFLSLKEKCNDIHKVIGSLKKDHCMVCYTTLDSSDLIVCLRDKMYKSAYGHINSYWDSIQKAGSGNTLRKVFSFLAMKQELLEVVPSGEVKNKAEVEKIACMLRVMVQDWNKIDDYLKEMKKQIGKLPDRKWGILGSDDLVLIYEDIDLKKWLLQYKKDGLLSHSRYNNVFYNIRTEFAAE